jgi:alpha-tubulin suppressor-like RCC1 family protein
VVQIPGLTGITAIAAGGGFTRGFALALDGSGRVWGLGDHSFGQLGDMPASCAGRARCTTPAPITGLSNITAISAGGSFTVALDRTGVVWALGSNKAGQAGDTGACRVGASTCNTPVQVPAPNAVAAIAAGGDFTLTLDARGRVYGLGDNNRGQLGDTDGCRAGAAVCSVAVPVLGLPAVTAIAAGIDHSLALDASGNLWGLGNDYEGQIGDAPPDTCPAGRSRCSAAVQIPGLTGITAIAAGRLFTLALDGNGRVWGLGDDAAGQLGTGCTGMIDHAAACSTAVAIDGLPPSVAIAASDSFSLALDRTGRVWGLGDNEAGQLGDTPGICPAGARICGTPVAVPGLTDIRVIAAGEYHTLALDGAGHVWGLGNNVSGELGVAEEACPDRIACRAPVQIPGLVDITAIGGAPSHTLAVDASGTVFGVGSNEFGQLGDTPGSCPTRPSSCRTVVPIPGLPGSTAVSGGGGFTLALDKSGHVWALGRNADGQTGEDRSATCTGEYQDICSTAVQIPGLDNVTAVAAGFFYSLALDANGIVWGLGYNQDGQLGDTPGVCPSGANACRQVVQVPGFTGATAIAAGHYFSLALGADGTVYGLGENAYGELGDTPGSCPTRTLDCSAPTP